MKTLNEYSNTIDPTIYEKIPKAVLAAILVSKLSNGGNSGFKRIDKDIMHEWQALHENGIVDQKPPKIIL